MKIISNQKKKIRRFLPFRLADYLVLATRENKNDPAEIIEQTPALNHCDLELPMKIECFIYSI